MIRSFSLGEKDLDLLDKYMQDNKIKNQSVAIRECIKRSSENKNLSDSIFDMNSKLNRLIRNQFLMKKLLEQLFVNEEFSKNNNIENSKRIEEFYKKYDNYKSNMG